MERIKTRPAEAEVFKSGILPAAAKCAGWALAGAAMSGSVLGGICAPFTPAVAAALPLPACIALCLGGAARSLLTLTGAQLAQAEICLLLTALGRIAAQRQPRLRATVAPLAMLTAALISGWLPAPAIMPLVSCVICALLTAGVYFAVAPLGAVAAGRPDALRAPGGLLATVTAVFAICAGMGFEVAGLSAGRILAVTCFLILIRGVDPRSAAACGTVGGFVLACADRELIVLAAVLALGGMVSCRAGKNRAVGCILFIVTGAALLLCCSVSYKSLVCIYELSAAALLTCALPLKPALRLGALFLRGGDKPESETPLRLAEALRRVGADCEQANLRLDGINSRRRTMLGAQERICGDCRNKNDCWNGSYRRTATAFSLADEDRSRGRQVSESYFNFCINRDKLCRALNALAPGAAASGSAALRQAAGQQFSLMAALAEDIARGEDGRRDETLSEALFSLCERVGLAPIESCATVFENGRLELTAACAVSPGPERRQRLAAGLAGLCAARLSPPKFTRDGGGCRLRSGSLPAVEVRCHCAQKAAEGDCCGDATLQESDGAEGVFLLSDGMGTGVSAALDANMTLGVFSRLYRAGASPQTALRCACLGLMARTDSESLATFDGLLVDRCSATAVLLKAGAPPTLLLRKGKLLRIEGGALPVGIIGEAEYSLRKLRLQSGDKLLMFSDGLEEQAAADGLTRSAIGAPRGFCQALAQQAFDAGGGRDDVTVMLVEIV